MLANANCLASRIKETDAREIQAYYLQYYEHHVRTLDLGERAARCIPIICSTMQYYEHYVIILSSHELSPILL